MLTSKAIFFEFPTRKKYGVPSHNFVKTMFCAKKLTKLPDLTVLSADIIPNSAVGIFSPKTEGTKT
jgi:hypothetical protein